MGKHRPATTPAPAAQPPAPEAPPADTGDHADKPENMVESIAAADAPLPAAPTALPDKPADQPASKADSATPPAPVTSPASAPDLFGDPKAIAARIAELGDPHSRVVAASNRLARIVQRRFEESLRLEREENEARWNVQRVQSVAQIEKEELRLLKLRLEAIEAAEAKAKAEADAAKKLAPAADGGAAA